MEAVKRNYKNILLVVLSILFISACVLIFFLLKDKNNSIDKIKGEVILSDSKYVIIESDNKNYLIENIKGTYDVGDIVEFTYKTQDKDEKKEPITIKINDEDLIKKAEINNSNDNNINKPEDNKPITSDNNNSNNNANNYKPNNGNNQSNTGSVGNADEEVEAYFLSLQDELNSGSIKDSLKSGFITVVDFLFYGGKIKGHTFNELSSATKLKVLSVALYFDSKIDKYFPGYKESISNTASKVYTSVKNEIVKSYLTVTTAICNQNSEMCEKAKEGFQNIKTNFGLTFDLIKEIAGDGFTNLKNWYEIWSGKTT